MNDQQSVQELSVRAEQPIVFRSTSEETAVGAFMGGMLGAMGPLILSGLVGHVGTLLGRFCGGYPTLGGSVVTWLLFWFLPLWMLTSLKPLWRLVTGAVAGAVYVGMLQWHIHQRDIGDFYPWILTALPFGIVLGTMFEPLRLAKGGTTATYVDRGITITSGFITYGNRAEMFLMIGYILGMIADLVSLGRPRIGATFGGLLGGGVSALTTSSVVAWRGDVQVADLFLGSVWNIAWACTTLGALTGAVSGCWAALIRERQQARRLLLIATDRGDRRTPAD